MTRFTRSLSVMLSVAIATASMSYELCGAAGEDAGDAHSLHHSHGGYQHLHHHHHHDNAAGGGDHDDDHDGLDHLPIDLKAVWTTRYSQQAETPTVFPPATCVAWPITARRIDVCHGVPPPLVGPDPTRQLRQIRSIVLLV